MTLRDLVQQAGGINSPVMDYDLRLASHNKVFMLDVNSEAVSNVQTPQNGSGIIYIELKPDETLWLHKGEL